MTLEEQITALIREHGLSSLSITALAPMLGGTDVWFTATAQGDGKCGTDTASADRSSIAQAVTMAVENLNELRAKAVLVPVLVAA